MTDHEDEMTRTRVRRFQWQANRREGQAVGDQVEIRPLTAAVWDREVRPFFWPDRRQTLAEYQAKSPGTTHYMAWRPAGGIFQPRYLGSVESLTLFPGTRQWALEVDRFDSPEARAWGETINNRLYWNQEPIPPPAPLSIKEQVAAATAALDFYAEPLCLEPFTFANLLTALHHAADALGHDWEAIERDAAVWYQEDRDDPPPAASQCPSH